MSSYGITDKGIYRPSNQDSFVILERGNLKSGFVCDGIGGNRAGDIASKETCKFIENSFNNLTTDFNSQKWIVDVVDEANEYIYKSSLIKPEYRGMGTTLVGFIDDGDRTFIINVGDSRCYGIIDGKLQQITEDHTLINELINKKGYTYQQASKLAGKNVIARAIGIGITTESDLFEAYGYDSLLLCSDGLHSYVSEKEIEKVCLSDLSAKEKSEMLVEMANDAGGLDNITVIVYQR